MALLQPVVSRCFWLAICFVEQSLYKLITQALSTEASHTIADAIEERLEQEFGINDITAHIELHLDWEHAA